MARRVLDVFLSSTAIDLAEHRKAVHERLMQTGLFHCVWQEDFGAQNAGAVDFCRKQAQEADLFVGLIGLRRGWEPDGDNEKRSITEMEHDWARDAGHPRYLWVAPDDFPVPGNMRESDEQYDRQMAFRKRVTGGGLLIVSQKGFGSPDLLASEIVEHLLVQVVTTDLLNQIRPEATPPGQLAPSQEDQAPAIAAAVERLAEDKDVDLLALAKDPKGIDVGELEAKLMAREKELEAEAGRTTRKRAEYWRHIGALAFFGDTRKALAAYEKATELDPNDPEGWRYLGELQHRAESQELARNSFAMLLSIGERLNDENIQSLAYVRLSWIERVSGQLSKAFDLANRSLQLAQEAMWDEGIARAYSNLGLISEEQGNLKLAEQMQLRSLSLFEQLGDRSGIAIAYGNLGIIFRRCGNLQQSEEAQLKALSLFKELGSKEGMATAYRGLAVIYGKNNDKAKICEYLRKERDLWRAMGLEGKAAGAEKWMRLNECGEE